jgi:hypothetical protein
MSALLSSNFHCDWPKNGDTASPLICSAVGHQGRSRKNAAEAEPSSTNAGRFNWRKNAAEPSSTNAAVKRRCQLPFLVSSIQQKKNQVNRGGDPRYL